MKVIEINKDSWHYRLADLPIWTDDIDSCSYFARVASKAFGLVVASAVVLTAFVVGMLALASLLAWLGALITIGFVVPDSMGAAGLAFIAIVISAGSIIGIMHLVRDGVWMLRRASVSENKGLLGVAYTSWRDKVCYKVKFK